MAIVKCLFALINTEAMKAAIELNAVNFMHISVHVLSLVVHISFSVYSLCRFTGIFVANFSANRSFMAFASVQPAKTNNSSAKNL